MLRIVGQGWPWVCRAEGEGREGKGEVIAKQINVQSLEEGSSYSSKNLMIISRLMYKWLIFQLAPVLQELEQNQRTTVNEVKIIKIFQH